MKKLHFLIITLISLSAFSQKDYSRYYNSWRLGLNVGGAWQTADYRSCWGMAGGITLEKGFHENSTNIFSFAIRGRYLAANTYGMDYSRNYDVKGNDAYNGKYDVNVNYADSAHMSKAYVYDNYKMQLGEGSLELQITFNRLRERTHVLLNLWGGIGFTSYRTKSDLLDGNNKMYDFSLVDSTGNKTKTLNTYNGLIDKKYESYAYGSKNGRLVTFSPSLGIGLGYQFSPVFSMLWEYKVTFPQGTNADLLDGKLSANKDAIGGSNDYYHYTGLNLVFTLRGKHKTKTKDETTYTPPVQPTTPVNPVTPVNPIEPPTNTVVATPPPPPAEARPLITYITPPENGQHVNNAQYKISAEILNVSRPDQIQFKLNGTGYTNFSFNAQNHILEYNATLVNGNNPIQIIASNTAGSDNKSTVIVYDQPKPTGTPPSVSYINPAQAGTASANQSYIVKAQVLNVAAQNGISVYVNGMSVPFTYDVNSKQVSIPVNLRSGSNSISITANNSYGEDTKLTDINYNLVAHVKAAPLVTITNPATSSTSVVAANYIFKASATNTTSKNQLTVKLNGTIVSNYTFMAPDITLPATLIQGNNLFEVTATNTDGSDSKNTIVNYKPKSAIVPPVVSLINPATEINATDNQLYNFKLSVINVASKANIEVIFNGVAQSNFTYDITTKELFFQSNLTVGSNTLSVKATNQIASDFKQIMVTYKPHAQIKLPPVVTMINPGTSPESTSTANYTFKADVTNVSNNSGLMVKFNGNVVTNYTYTNGTVTYPAVLLPGNNAFIVAGSNADGTDYKNVTVIYRPKAAAVPPVVSLINPATEINATDNQLYNFKLSVVNVASKSDIEVLFNGTTQSNFTYDATTKEIFFQTNLIKGNNSLSVKGTNQAGSDSKQITVNYTPHVRIKLPPAVTFVNPNTATVVTQNNSYEYSATIENMPVTTGLIVTYNGTPITNYTYDGANLSFPASLTLGGNSLQITATNNDGSDTKTATVNYRPKASAKPPLVSIFAPAQGMPVVNTPSFNFQFRAIYATQNQIEVTLNGIPVTSFTFASMYGGFTGNLKPGKNTLSVKATNADGTVTKTADVAYILSSTTVTAGPGANLPDTVQVSTGNGANTNGGKMTICHQVAGGEPKTMDIPSALWNSHKAHGDTQGACPVKKDGVQVTPDNGTPQKANVPTADTLNKKPANMPINTTPRRPR